MTRPTFLALLLAALLSACAAPVAPPNDPPAPLDRTIYVLAKDWHTEVALPTKDITGPLTRFRAIFPDAAYMAFGFGGRTYTQKPKADVLDMVVAVFPGPGIMMTTALADAPPIVLPHDEMVPIKVTQAELDRMADYVWESLEKDPSDRLNHISDGAFPGYVFYGATPTYNGFFTCNTWTIKVLDIGGLDAGAPGVLLADQAMTRARTVAARRNGGT